MKAIVNVIQTLNSICTITLLMLKDNSIAEARVNFQNLSIISLQQLANKLSPLKVRQHIQILVLYIPDPLSDLADTLPQQWSTLVTVRLNVDINPLQNYGIKPSVTIGTIESPFLQYILTPTPPHTTSW